MWYVEMGGVYRINNNNVFGRKIYTDIKDIDTYRKKFNNRDVYVTTFQYDNENQNESNLYGPLYIDLDMDFNDDTEYNKIKQDLVRIVTYLNIQYKIPTKYMRFYFTGKKGFHIIIPTKVFDVKPDKYLNIYYKEIAKELNSNTIYNIVDTKIYDNKRLLRLINSINGKTGLYKVPISYDNIQKLSYEGIKEYASSEKHLTYEKVEKVDRAVNKLKEIKDNIMKKKESKKKRKCDISKFKNIPFAKCIQAIFNEGANIGYRNNTTVILASAMFQRGVDYDTVLKIISDWNAEKNNPSLTDKEVEITVKSAEMQVEAGRFYGCSSIKELGYCIGEKCKLYK